MIEAVAATAKAATGDNLDGLNIGEGSGNFAVSSLKLRMFGVLGEIHQSLAHEAIDLETKAEFRSKFQGDYVCLFEQAKAK